MSELQADILELLLNHVTWICFHAHPSIILNFNEIVNRFLSHFKSIFFFYQRFQSH